MSFRFNEAASPPQEHRALPAGRSALFQNGGVWLAGNTSLTPLMLVRQRYFERYS
jgi:hypothetical protein